MSEKKERFIGEVFSRDGVDYIIVETRYQDCDACDLQDYDDCLKHCRACMSCHRRDGREVVAKEVVK